MSNSKTKKWPKWFFNADDGDSDIFEKQGDVPKDWVTRDELLELRPNFFNDGPESASADLDAQGHSFNATIHNAKREKTKDNLWRMKPGIKRPAPVQGFDL